MWIVLALIVGLIVGWVVGGVWAFAHFKKVAPRAYQEMRTADANIICDFVRRR